jgi:hypothetical protein
MNTEYDTRADSSLEPYDSFPELTFPSGLRLADLFDLVRERPRDNRPVMVMADQAASKPASAPAVS